MLVDYDYEINESGVIIIKNLSYQHKCVEIPREEQFKSLYSYALIDVDLNYSISFLEKCVKTKNDMERQCFFRMAVIQYAKCYTFSKHGGRQ